MPRRPNTVTQSEVCRNIRAVQAANLKIARVVVRRDGVSIETIETTETASEMPDELKVL